VTITNHLESECDSYEGKFSYDSIMRPQKLKKGRTRWNQCEEQVREIDSSLLQGSILDFGSGVGYFLLEGLKRGHDAWGMDILPGKIKRYTNLVEFSKSPEEWKQRSVQGSGSAIPFAENTFSIVTSWFVFEHIEHPGEVLREIVRVTNPGGIIVIRAQDARCNWEGHCKIPWVPFLPDNLEKVWIEEFGSSPTLRQDVFDITQPQIISILETMGCSIVRKDKPLVPQISQHHLCYNKEKVREIARQVKKELEDGIFIPRQDGLYLIARKAG